MCPSRHVVLSLCLCLLTASCRQQTALSDTELALADRVEISPVLALEMKTSGQNLRQLEGRDDTGERSAVDGLSIDVQMDETYFLRERLQQLAGPGLVVFVATRGYGMGADEIAVQQTENPCDTITVMGSHGGNYNIWPEDIVATFIDLDKRFGLELTGAGPDWVQGDFKRQPTDMLAFAKEVYEFCPDVVQQGTDTVPGLADAMAQTSRVFLWSD